MATNVQMVRALIGDNAAGSQVYTDDELATFLEIRDDAVRLAAADALNALANKMARGAQIEVVGDYRLDNTKGPELLRLAARELVSLENEIALTTPAYGVAEENVSTFSERSIIANLLQRNYDVV